MIGRRKMSTFTYNPQYVSNGTNNTFDLNCTDSGYTFSSSQTYTLTIDAYTSPSISGNDTSTITFSNVDLSSLTGGNSYLVNISGTDGYSGTGTTEIEVFEQSTITAPTTLDKFATNTVNWGNPGYTFLNGTQYFLTINNIQVASVSGNGNNSITFTNVSLNGFGDIQPDNNYNIGVTSAEYNVVAGTQVSISCFVKGTKIVVKNSQGIEEYCKIEDLKVGDTLKTYKDGDKKIKYISYRKYKNNKNDLNQIYKINPELYLTGGHSLLVDELTPEQEHTMISHSLHKKIHDKYLLLSAFIPSAEPVDNDDEFELFHVVLENEDRHGQYGIYIKNGESNILGETMSIDWYEIIHQNQVRIV